MLEHVVLGRTVLVVVALGGMALCSVGIGKVAEAGAWLDLWSLAAYVLGAAMLAILVASLAGVPLPLVGSPWAGTLVILGLIGVKAVITRLHAL